MSPSKVEKKCCANCLFWDDGKHNFDYGWRGCHFPLPPLPFWAQLEPIDRSDLTLGTDGHNCLTFQKKT